MDVDESFKIDSPQTTSIFKCYLCTTDFQTKVSFMKHKKSKHVNSVQVCGRSGTGNCTRKDEDCWYFRSSEKIQPSSPSSSKSKQDFCEVPEERFPPDQMTQILEMMNSLCSKVKTIEKRMIEGKIKIE